MNLEQFISASTGGDGGDTYYCKMMESSAHSANPCHQTGRSGQATKITTVYCGATTQYCFVSDGSSHVRVHTSWYQNEFNNVAWTWTIEFIRGSAGYQQSYGTIGQSVSAVSESVGQTVYRNMNDIDYSGTFGGAVTVPWPGPGPEPLQ